MGKLLMVSFDGYFETILRFEEKSKKPLRYKYRTQKLHV